MPYNIRTDEQNWKHTGEYNTQFFFSQDVCFNHVIIECLPIIDLEGLVAAYNVVLDSQIHTAHKG